MLRLPQLSAIHLFAGPNGNLSDVSCRLKQVVSPRFKGPLAGALASHPLLQLKNWDPWRPVKELAAHLRMFLEVRCCQNCPHLHIGLM